MDISLPIFQLAESLNTYLPLGPGDARIEGEERVIYLGNGSDHPAFTVVQRLRLGDDVAAVIHEVRATLAAHGRLCATWEVGPSSTPRDLVERLTAHGMVAWEEPVATGMVLRQPLARTQTEVTVRRAETVEDCAAAFDVLSRVFGERTETPAERRARAEQEIAHDGPQRRGVFLAELEGELVAAATTLYADAAPVLCGAATLEHARGRGAYRALVAARYDDAVRRGTPTLVIQAGAMSKPILLRLGFESVAEIQILLDDQRPKSTA